MRLLRSQGFDDMNTASTNAKVSMLLGEQNGGCNGQ